MSGLVGGCVLKRSTIAGHAARSSSRAASGVRPAVVVDSGLEDVAAVVVPAVGSVAVGFVAVGFS
jgi:hypothetical protein